MPLKEKIAEKAGIDENKMPARFQIIGHVLLAKLFYMNKEEKKKFAKAVLDALPYIKTVCEIKEISGRYRKPGIIKLLGNGTETVHKENSILYKIDVKKIMFSKGNLLERKRLLGSIMTDEKVIDMFAGIGYFSLQIAKKCQRVYAIEKNPIAFRYLKENIKLNKIDNIKPILGDSRNTMIKEKVDRVLMGYFVNSKFTKSQKAMFSEDFPGTEKFLPSAFRFLKEKGLIHYHNLYKRNDFSAPIQDVEKAAKKAGFAIKTFKQRTVKSYNSVLDHIVLDVEAEKAV